MKKVVRLALLVAVVIAVLLVGMGFEVEVKDGVILGLAPEVADKLPLIDEVHYKTVGRGVIITSGRDGDHMAGSLHYVGRAIDVRTRDLTNDQAARLTAALQRALPGWDVIREYDPPHIHLEVE